MARVTAADLTRFVGVGDPQLSPDGKRILFTVTRTGEKNDRIGRLSEVEIESGKLRTLTGGEKSSSNGRYLPDGSGILFSSAREGTTNQLFLLPTSGGEARRITDFAEGSLGEVRISPDGKRIAYAYRETHPNRTTEAEKERSEKGGSEPAWEIDDLWYRLDGDGYFGPQRYKLFTLELPPLDGPVGEFAVGTLLSEAAPHGEFSFDWAPDSQRLAVSHSARKDPFVETPNDQIWIYRLDGSHEQIPGLPTGDKSALRWSPDGELIAYAGDVDEDDPWGTRNTRLYVVSPEGGEPKNLSEGTDFDLGVATLSDTKEAAFGAVYEWAPDSSCLYAQIGWHGSTQIGRFSKDGGAELLGQSGQYVGLGSVSQEKAAVVVGHPTMLPEIGIADLGSGEVTTLTGLNDDLDLEFAKPEPFTTTAEDGQEVHGWILLPVGYKEGTKLPCAIEVHGGPHTQYGEVFFHEFQVLAAEGYAVVYSNPRGSKGYGEAFCAAIHGNWGTKDWLDVQAVTKWAKAHPAIDPDRVGIVGGSYGGYMTNWAIGHSKEYKAAITDRCVSNLVSMAGNSDFPFNKDAYFKGIAYGDLEQIKELWRQSPISAFEGVTTPTLVIHSEGDLRCNIEQGEQVFTALKMQGVPSRFVRYPRSTSHGMSRSGPNDLRIHRLNEIVSWFEKYLK